ncbi:putative ubiquitin-conjugating enzyme E2, ubiquitin-conjugating enzyme/RWD [Helianthus annuus]|nr:putative ubiquitin-conjugating enzyme E2, ubiquitin-conjugating enzyme/RWD [Helianthus annuus]
MDIFLSDFDSYSESSSSDDQEDDEFMYSGQATSILSNLQETIGKIDDFLLFERRYVHGDIVYSGKDRDSQMGKVTNVEIVVDLENINEKKVKDISSKKLAKIRSISTGEFVISGPWVGKAENITDSVTVLFDDGTKCEFAVTGLETEKLVPISPDIIDDSQYPYYPGQRVKAVNMTPSKSTHWFCGSKNRNQDEGTVCSVDSGLVHVTWLGCALLGSESVPEPPSLQNSKDLIPVSCFAHSNWQIGDWCMLPKPEHRSFTDRFPVRKQSNNRSDFQEIFVIAKMKCKVDVLWQDGSESCGLYSNTLGPINALDAHDFWPHQFVLEKGTSDDQQDRKWGVVKAVDPNEKTVKVKWESEIEETVSAYELIEHPNYSYNQGDLVLRLNKGQIVENGEKCSSDRYLDHIGMVVGLKNGSVEVKWASGFTSKVAPHELLRVEKSEGPSATPLLNTDNIQEDQEKSGISADPRDKSFLGSDDGDDCLKTLYESTTFNVPRAAIELLSDVAKSLFGFPFYASLSAAPDHVPENEPMSGFNKEDDPVIVETSSEANFNEVKESKDEIKQFDMVNDCSSHHFVDSPGKSSISSQVKRSWLKKVQQEWSILENNLPETIYVRVFEERMDLIQAAIVGAPETPYHDCLFFFDIFLPPEYPHEPPMVHYESGGLRVNPNLYESGRVCLSLLKTWTGTGTETWNPDGSTILQVLLSLQALVLNKNPYFNEAGYDQQIGSPEGEKNSGSYNENAFLMSCKSMLYILRKPPKHFEALVEEHFSKRCVHILTACKAYMEGVPVGCAFDSPYVEPEGHTGNSTGFKIMLSKLVPKLMEAFAAKGFDCGEFSKTG